ncbi:MAG: lactonase family protein [Clostridiales bacterium]|jgi:6-phosphogluconolactonase|nr:lactonase family protein [Clostridiales bacterium]
MEKKLNNTAAFYVGTYTDGTLSEGIYKCEVNLETGIFKALASGDFVKNPSYLAFSPDKKKLYAVLETEQYEGAYGGAAAVFNISDPDKITLAQTALTGGSAPCHISVDTATKHVFAANYGDGVVSVFNADGFTLSAAFKHQPTAQNPTPHAHFTAMAPGGKYLCAVDLGLDAIITYEYDDARGKFSLFEPCPVATGSGPRHIVFSPDGKTAYAVHELSSEVEAFDYKDGRFASKQKLGTLPEGFAGENSCAAIKISADGKKLFASNRGHDSIAVYDIDEGNGLLNRKGIYGCGGRSPRDFALVHDECMIVANQDSNAITLLKADENGNWAQVGDAFPLPGAVCVLPVLA